MSLIYRYQEGEECELPQGKVGDKIDKNEEASDGQTYVQYIIPKFPYSLIINHPSIHRSYFTNFHLSSIQFVK